MDDDEQLRQAAGRALVRLGYTAAFARTGEEAVALYAGEKVAGKGFDAVVMDLTVPGGMGAQEAARRLLELDPEARLVVSSGYARHPLMQEHRTFGFCHRVVKPYTMEELGRVLQEVLG
jgi:CheY-like chemotaxis protein